MSLKGLNLNHADQSAEISKIHGLKTSCNTRTENKLRNNMNSEVELMRIKKKNLSAHKMEGPPSQEGGEWGEEWWLKGFLAVFIMFSFFTEKKMKHS